LEALPEAESLPLGLTNISSDATAAFGRQKQNAEINIEYISFIAVSLALI
jgi:hypothetical protein